MAVAQQEIVEAIEESFFLLPEVPGLNTHIAVPGVDGHYAPVSSPEINLVGKTHLTEANAGAIIEQVKDIFRREQLEFGWLTTPSTEPPDFGEHLERAGLPPAIELAGMVLTDLHGPIASNSSVHIWRATSEDIDDASAMMARSYGFPDEAAPFLVAYSTAMNELLDCWFYLASLDGGSEPVAWAATVFMPNTPIVVLQGAATMPEHRGHGLYSSLVARRLKDAREHGAEAAVIQAKRDTSAPIAAKLGFQEICTMMIHAWKPESSA